MTELFVFSTALILCIVLLVWWSRACKWDTYEKHVFPTKGHVILLSLAALFPIWNIVEFIILLAIYLIGRLTGDILLKPTKFNHKWFGVELKDEKEN